jgi:hypothetical protein
MGVIMHGDDPARSRQHSGPSCVAGYVGHRVDTLASYLETRKLPVDPSVSGEGNLRDMTRLRKKASRYELRDGQLWKLSPGKQSQGPHPA